MQKYITLSMLSLQSIFGYNHHIRNRCWSGWTTYTSIFDEKESLANNFVGEFEMKICNDHSQARYAINIDGDFEGEAALKYHLHSDYNDQALLGVLGGEGTGGHYDPEFKCGTASSNKADTTRCEFGYTCSSQNVENCEKGDLSGKLGVVPIVNNKICKKRLRDFNPPRNCDYSSTGSQTGAVFSSIVFHKASDGSRLFGGRVIKECSETMYRATLDGSGINRGVTGTFTMHICNDGSHAVYQGSFENVDPNESALKYHLHSAFIDNGDLGGSGTGGHYDPLFKCGSASSYKTSPLCESDYPNNGYELGDLSGRNGVVQVNDGRVNFRIVDLDPPRNCDYDEDGLVDYGNYFSSVVFHKASDGSRLFGSAIKRCNGKLNWIRGVWEYDC